MYLHERVCTEGLRRPRLTCILKYYKRGQTFGTDRITQRTLIISFKNISQNNFAI